MERLTKPLGDGKRYTVGAAMITSGEAGYSGEAITRLAMYENVHEQLLSRQDDIGRELEKLRGEGRQKSGRFKELLARKLMNKGILDLFE